VLADEIPQSGCSGEEEEEEDEEKKKKRVLCCVWLLGCGGET